jgi:hypothetical protein
MLLAPKANYGIKSNVFIVIMPSSSFKMVYYIVMVFCMFLMAMCDFKFSKLGTMFWLQAILDPTRPWSKCFEIIGRQNFRNIKIKESKVVKNFRITFQDYISNHYNFLFDHNQSQMCFTWLKSTR